MSNPSPSKLQQTLIGIGVVAVGAGMAFGALSISSASGYAGVGPNFLPWLVAIGLMVCGAGLVREAQHGGYRKLEAPSGAPRGDWRALAWVSAGVLVNAALVVQLGFVLSCTLCFVLAVRGFRISQGKPAGGLRQTLIDTVTGALIAAPVFWMFTQVLGIHLPGLTPTGWL
jgi:putative tricarboxylic transport membrane protein